jgi:hypothetical protein
MENEVASFELFLAQIAVDCFQRSDLYAFEDPEVLQESNFLFQISSVLLAHDPVVVVAGKSCKRAILCTDAGCRSSSKARK